MRSHVGAGGWLATEPIEDEPEYVRRRTLDSVLVHASELDCPGAGGTAVLRDVSGAYYVGDDFQSRGNGVSIRLLGTNIVRSFRKSEVFSLAPMAAHTQAEAQIIGTRQRRGEPALVLPLTEKQRAARRRSDFENGKRPKAEK